MRYGSLEAVRGIDLDVKRGQIFAFLGPNGAGKTTTVEILEGYRRRSSGEVTVLGADPERAGSGWRARVGVVLQTCQPEQELTVAETIEFYAGLYDSPRPVADLLTLVGLSEQWRVRNERLSSGQRRRLDIALALVGDPELLFLDEPTTGFDPAARRAAWSMIAELRRLGMTIFLTTHYLEEAEALADRIAVITRGEIIAEGTPATLGGRDQAATEIAVVLDRPVAADELPSALGGRAQVTGKRLELTSSEPVRDLYILSGWILEHGLGADVVEVHRPSLEDVYLRLTAEAART
jgi:ABC-2 type transport system ATP-binding protein